MTPVNAGAQRPSGVDSSRGRTSPGPGPAGCTPAASARRPPRSARSQISRSSARRPDDRGTAQLLARVPAPPGRGQLRDEREPGLPGELRGLPRRPGQQWPAGWAPPGPGRAGTSSTCPPAAGAGPPGAGGNANASRSASPCSARKIAPASSVAYSTARRPIRLARPSRPPRRSVADHRDGAARRSGRPGSGNSRRGPRAPRAPRTPARRAGPGCGSRPGCRGAACSGRT